MDAASFRLRSRHAQSVPLPPHKYRVVYTEGKKRSKVGNAECVQGGQERRGTNLSYDGEGQKRRELKRGLEQNACVTNSLPAF